MSAPAIKVLKIWVDPTRLKPDLWALLKPHQTLISECRQKATKHGPFDQGVAVLVEPPEWPDIDVLVDEILDAGRKPLLVVLDQVEDPMNLGQILRTCEGAGVDGIVIPKHRATHLSQTVAQISQGAFAWIPLVEAVNLRNELERLKQRGLWVIGCDAVPGAKPWFKGDFAEPTALVLGAEGKGLRSLTAKTCDQLVCLPMAGRVTSLNVGAATAAMVYEAVRQRRIVTADEGS